MSAVSAATSTARAVVRGSKQWTHKAPSLTKILDNEKPLKLSAEHDMPMGSWSSEQIKDAVNSSVMLTWSPGKARHGVPIITHGEGVYLYDDKGKKYLDWTS